ncbi:phosphorylase family protein [Sorangium sp. So ce1153]|uniref:5'-methylthioadenosine/S-adenosylhomocysteine nucleosidase family protein n=1 Tax=Sorangium sp. So ce1153 TaxID=3133333 RepID=UPI003F5E318A
MNEDILEKRLRREAERRGADVEDVRRQMLDLGLEAARKAREREAHAREVQADVLLVTATRTEHEKLREAALSRGLSFDRRPGRFGPYYRIGRVGGNRVASIQVAMGAFGAEGSAARCIQSRAETQATTLILLGTAFGVNRDHQSIGDVLVSESVFLYDDRRVVDAEIAGRLATTVEGLCGLADRATSSRWALARWARRLTGPGYALDFRTALRPASVTWVERFRRLAVAWEREGEAERVTVGTVLSGGARIESARFMDDLLLSLPSMESPIVGGEMEAAGAVAAETGDEPGWIVVKGISDFAEAVSRTKEELEENRKHAARSSARAVLRALGTDPMSA